MHVRLPNEQMVRTRSMLQSTQYCMRDVTQSVQAAQRAARLQVSSRGARHGQAGPGWAGLVSGNTLTSWQAPVSGWAADAPLGNQPEHG